MPDFFKSPFADGPEINPLSVLVRLLMALAMGGVVSWIYRKTRNSSETSPSFAATLVLLSVLIAMVTQVIGDNVARAFSLVGALSIVRFRTVVRDTQDTAYVIFAVVVGMSIGAKNLWVGGIGILVIGLAAWLMMRGKPLDAMQPVYVLNLRVVKGFDLEAALGAIMDKHLHGRQLISLGTAKQGMLLDAVYETRMLPSGSPEGLVKALNQIEGVQSAQLDRKGVNLD